MLQYIKLLNFINKGVYISIIISLKIKLSYVDCLFVS